MNRHLAHALGATALGALLLQPVTRWPTARTRAQRELCALSRLRSPRRRRPSRLGFELLPARGYVVHHLPPRHRVVHHHGHRYYYGGGAWYRPYGSHYVAVDPPVGLVVSFLPQFSTALHVGGVPYYRAGPVYYVWSRAHAATW